MNQALALGKAAEQVGDVAVTGHPLSSLPDPQESLLESFPWPRREAPVSTVKSIMFHV